MLYHKWRLLYINWNLKGGNSYGTRVVNPHFFAKAKLASKLSDYPRYHIGCVVAYKKQILSVGFNTVKTHPIQKIYNKERFDCDSRTAFLMKSQE